MEITRNVILDLLPLYSANEVSADTRALVEKYLKTDPELANVAKQLEAMEKPRKIPAPLSQDDEMKAYRKARRQNHLHTILIAGVISIAFILMVSLWMFFFSS
jgi:anti-sigma factor RsiW